MSASERLRKILREKTLRRGKNIFGDARFGQSPRPLTPAEQQMFFSSICLSETPLSEVHCLLEVNGRFVQLQPYGVVFIKDKLQKRGVAPVLYLNNERDDQKDILDALCKLIESDQNVAKKLLPLISVFGSRIITDGTVDWYWEREWRYPAVEGDLPFNDEEVFVCLCPEEQISAFEKEFPGFTFVDPKGNPRWYAQKLINRRKDLGLKHSVV